MSTDAIHPPASTPAIAFIGGGNMASAIIGGLLRQGWPADAIDVVEPWDEQRARLAQQFGLQAQVAATARVARARLVVWAVKPQVLREAASACSGLMTGDTVHLSVAAGIRSDALANWLDSPRVVRAMPNTPALVGQGMTGLFARPAVTAADRNLVDRVLAPTGELMWLTDETALDAVTALSGSGPAYVFYFIEAMTQAGADLGLARADAHRLAVATFTGASALARASDEPPELLRQRVTSKGGTTHAAITHLDAQGVKAHFMAAIATAAHRARELGDEFGR